MWNLFHTPFTPMQIGDTMPQRTKEGRRALPFLHALTDKTERFYRIATSPIRLLPDFLIIGGQRCGTTSLYHYLMEQPDMKPAAMKEVHFFDCNNFYKGPLWYQAKFPSAPQKFMGERLHTLRPMTGEATPYYLFHPHAPKRVAQIMPKAKLIVLLRNPVERAYSQYWLESQENESLPFEDAIAQEEERIGAEREKLLKDERYQSYNYRHYSYLARGVYIDQLLAWMEVFPREQFLILKSEDLFEHPASVLQQTLAFLNRPAQLSMYQEKDFKRYREPTPEGYRKAAKPTQMKPETRQFLIDYYRPHNARLSAFVGRDFGW
jgi:hypothetical protein